MRVQGFFRILRIIEYVFFFDSTEAATEATEAATEATEAVTEAVTEATEAATEAEGGKNFLRIILAF